MPSWASAQARDLAGTVYRASSLLTQSQRLSKAYCLWGLKIEVDDAQRIVGECVAQSERTIGELSAAPQVSKETYAALAKLWGRARDLTVQAPSAKSMDGLLVLDSQMLGIANEGAAHLLRQHTQPELMTVDTAARLAMLSQRLAKFHFCALWGVAPRLAATQTAKSKEEFQTHLRSLQGAAKTAAQRQALEAAHSQWVFFDAALQHSTLGAEAGVHTRLARASETMLQVFNDLAPKFARLA